MLEGKEIESNNNEFKNFINKWYFQEKFKNYKCSHKLLQKQQ